MNDSSPSTTVTPLEDRFRTPSGDIDTRAVQDYLQQQQARADELSLDEVREAIQLTRILRRTNTTTGPAKKRVKPKLSDNPDDLLSI